MSDFLSKPGLAGFERRTALVGERLASKGCESHRGAGPCYGAEFIAKKVQNRSLASFSAPFYLQSTRVCRQPEGDWKMKIRQSLPVRQGVYFEAGLFAGLPIRDVWKTDYRRNQVVRKAARSFSPPAAICAKVGLPEVGEFVPGGSLGLHHIHSPRIHVQRIEGEREKRMNHRSTRPYQGLETPAHECGLWPCHAPSICSNPVRPDTGKSSVEPGLKLMTLRSAISKSLLQSTVINLPLLWVCFVLENLFSNLGPRTRTP